MLIIHTDGACHGNPGPGGWSAFWDLDGQNVELMGGEPSTTNNRMELEGPLRALVWLADQGYRSSLLIRSDSQYVVKGLTEWRKGWERRQWRASTGGPVKNADLWKALFATVDSFQGRANFEWVRGHNGDPGNERADRLALEGLQAARARGKGAWAKTPNGLMALKVD
jgi:ribonuclease HI